MPRRKRTKSIRSSRRDCDVLVALIQTLAPPDDAEDSVEVHDTGHCSAAEENYTASIAQPTDENVWVGPVITRRVLALAKKLGIPPEALL